MNTQPKNLPFPVGFTNSRNFKLIRHELQGALGLGAAVLLIDYAVQQPNHEFPFSDLNFLSAEFGVSLKILQDIVITYDIFELVENNGNVVSPWVKAQLKPYYEAVENGKLGGQLSATRRKLKQKEQLLDLKNKLSELDSIQGGLEYPATTLQPYNKLINITNKEKKEIKEEFGKLKNLAKNLTTQQKSKLIIDELGLREFTLAAITLNGGLLNVLDSLEISTYDLKYLNELKKAYKTMH